MHMRHTLEYAYVLLRAIFLANVARTNCLCRMHTKYILASTRVDT